MKPNSLSAPLFIKPLVQIIDDALNSFAENITEHTEVFKEIQARAVLDGIHLMEKDKIERKAQQNNRHSTSYEEGLKKWSFFIRMLPLLFSSKVSADQSPIVPAGDSFLLEETSEKIEENEKKIAKNIQLIQEKRKIKSHLEKEVKDKVKEYLEKVIEARRNFGLSALDNTLEYYAQLKIANEAVIDKDTTHKLLLGILRVVFEENGAEEYLKTLLLDVAVSDYQVVVHYLLRAGMHQEIENISAPLWEGAAGKWKYIEAYCDETLLLLSSSKINWEKSISPVMNQLRNQEEIPIESTIRKINFMIINGTKDLKQALTLIRQISGKFNFSRPHIPVNYCLLFLEMMNVSNISPILAPRESVNFISGEMRKIVVAGGGVLSQSGFTVKVKPFFEEIDHVLIKSIPYVYQKETMPFAYKWYLYEKIATSRKVLMEHSLRKNAHNHNPQVNEEYEKLILLYQVTTKSLAINQENKEIFIHLFSLIASYQIVLNYNSRFIYLALENGGFHVYEDFIPLINENINKTIDTSNFIKPYQTFLFPERVLSAARDAIGISQYTALDNLQERGALDNNPPFIMRATYLWAFSATILLAVVILRRMLERKVTNQSAAIAFSQDLLNKKAQEVVEQGKLDSQAQSLKAKKTLKNKSKKNKDHRNNNGNDNSSGSDNGNSKKSGGATHFVGDLDLRRLPVHSQKKKKTEAPVVIETQLPLMPIFLLKGKGVSVVLDRETFNTWFENNIETWLENEDREDYQARLLRIIARAQEAANAGEIEITTLSGLFSYVQRKNEDMTREELLPEEGNEPEETLEPAVTEEQLIQNIPSFEEDMVELIQLPKKEPQEERSHMGASSASARNASTYDKKEKQTLKGESARLFSDEYYDRIEKLEKLKPLLDKCIYIHSIHKDAQEIIKHSELNKKIYIRVMTSLFLELQESFEQCKQRDLEIISLYFDIHSFRVVRDGLVHYSSLDDKNDDELITLFNHAISCLPVLSELPMNRISLRKRNYKEQETLFNLLEKHYNKTHIKKRTDGIDLSEGKRKIHNPGVLIFSYDKGLITSTKEDAHVQREVLIRYKLTHTNVVKSLADSFDMINLFLEILGSGNDDRNLQRALAVEYMNFAESLLPFHEIFLEDSYKSIWALGKKIAHPNSMRPVTSEDFDKARIEFLSMRDNIASFVGQEIEQNSESENIVGSSNRRKNRN